MIRPATIALLMAGVFGTSIAADDFDTMRSRWVEMLVGNEVSNRDSQPIKDRIAALTQEVVSNGRSRDAQTSTGFWDTMKTHADRTLLWTDIGRPARNSQIVVDSFKRLETLAILAMTPGGPLYRNPELIQDINDAVAWLLRDYYKAGTERKGLNDWWQLEIGIPMFLSSICVLMKDDMPTPLLEEALTAIDYFNPDPAMIADGTPTARPSTGSAIINKNRGHFAVGILRKSSDHLDRVQHNMTRIFSPAESGDGFYADASFVMHRTFPYTGGYGNALIQGLSEYGLVVSGTQWELDEKSSRQLADWYARGFAPFLWRGNMMSGVRGREVAREAAGEMLGGGNTLIAWMRGVQAVLPNDRKSMMAQASRLLLESANGLEGHPRSRPFDLKVADEASKTAPAPALTGFFAFPGMDRAVYRTKTWAALVAMHSKRISNYEAINGENRRGWHSADGMLYLYQGDSSPFEGAFWPTVDARRLPGTTVELGSQPKSGTGNSPWSGSLSTPNEEAGVAVMELAPKNQTLRARKAWFFFPKFVVCLGAGITASSDLPVETIIENRRLRSADAGSLRINGKPAGDSPEIPDVHTAWIPEEASGKGIGIFFPEPTRLFQIREARTASWKEINSGSHWKTTDTPFTESYQTLWLDHGIKPTAAKYAYAILPEASPEEVEHEAATRGFTILANDPELQAVQSNGWTLVSFGSPGGQLEVGSGTVSASAGCLLAINRSRKTLSLCDPSQMAGSNIVIDLGQPAKSVETTAAEITVERLQPTLRIVAKLGDLKGRSAALTWIE